MVVWHILLLFKSIQRLFFASIIELIQNSCQEEATPGIYFVLRGTLAVQLSSEQDVHLPELINLFP